MIIADTNVVSEFMKDAPDPAVLAWALELDRAVLSICVVTVVTLSNGLAVMLAARPAAMTTIIVSPIARLTASSAGCRSGAAWILATKAGTQACRCARR